MLPLNPIPPTINNVDDYPTSTPGAPTLIGAISPSIPVPDSSGPKSDLIAGSNENDLNNQLSERIAQFFDKFTQGYPIGTEGSDETRRGSLMMLDLKTSAESAIDDLKGREPKQFSDSVCKFLGAMVDLLKGDLDKEPDRAFETMVRRLLTKDLLQDPVRLASERCVLIAEEILTSELQSFTKLQACLSEILDIFNEADYRSDHPGYLMKVMENVTTFFAETMINE